MVFVCPRCHSPLELVAPDKFHCSEDDLIFALTGGIWRFLLPGREQHYAAFIRDYETVRRFEGRGSTDFTYYRILPYHRSSDWRVRAASFNALVDQVLRPLEKDISPLRILDLGAGNGWLSNRLASLGHEVAAVDLTANDFDGLGCYRFYDSTFIPVQAEFEYLPFPDISVDVALFNASLHYSVGYEESLREGLRVLDLDGKLVVLDSPVYHDAVSGREMVRERQAQFIQRYGFAADSLQSENYLTYQRMDELGARLGLTWRHIRPFYGIRWALRPLLARMRGRREPAEFGVWVGTKSNSR